MSPEQLVTPCVWLCPGWGSWLPSYGLWACDFTRQGSASPDHLLSPEAPCLQHRRWSVPPKLLSWGLLVASLVDIESPSFV